MNNPTEKTRDELFDELADVRASLQVIEANWKQLRAESRRITISLIVDHGVSILKASNLSGHQRSTITAWLAASGIRSTS